MGCSKYIYVYKTYNLKCFKIKQNSYHLTSNEMSKRIGSKSLKNKLVYLQQKRSHGVIKKYKSRK